LQIENNAIEKNVATILSKKNSRPKPKYRHYKREWKNPRWKPQPKKPNVVKMWVSKGVANTMRNLESFKPKQFNEYNANVLYGNSQRPNALRYNNVEINEAKNKGPIYKWVPKSKN